MTHTFKRIRDDHQSENIDVVKMITKIGNVLLNLQQMSAQQVVHLVLSLPLNKSSKKVFSLIQDQTMIKYLYSFFYSELNQEADDSENVIEKSLIDYYKNWYKSK